MTATYGIDPQSDELTLWVFQKDGAVATWRVTAYEDGKWVWEGETVRKDQVESARAVLTKIDANEMKLVVDNGGSSVLSWQRK